MSPKLSDEQKDQRRQLIIDAAIEVFKRKGYEKATLKDIVEEAAMSRGWIYLYYQDKIEIFKAILDQLDEQMAGELNELRARHRSVRDALGEFLSETKADVTSARDGLYPAIYEFFVAGWREPGMSEFFARRYNRVVAMLEVFLQSGVDTGEFRPNVRVSAIARTMMSSIDGILVHVLAFGSKKVHPEEQIDVLAKRVDQLLGGDAR